MSWIARAILIVAALLTGLFLAKDAENFPVVQIVVGLALIALVVGGLALWRRR